MDLEADIKSLVAEKDYIDELLADLTTLQGRVGYAGMSNDTATLISKLKDKRSEIRDELNDITGEMISVADALACVYQGASDAD